MGAQIKILSDRKSEKELQECIVTIAGSLSNRQDAACLILEQIEKFKIGGYDFDQKVNNPDKEGRGYKGKDGKRYSSSLSRSRDLKSAQKRNYQGRRSPRRERRTSRSSSLNSSRSNSYKKGMRFENLKRRKRSDSNSNPTESKSASGSRSRSRSRRRSPVKKMEKYPDRKNFAANGKKANKLEEQCNDYEKTNENKMSVSVSKDKDSHNMITEDNNNDDKNEFANYKNYDKYVSIYDNKSESYIVSNNTV